MPTAKPKKPTVITTTGKAGAVGKVKTVTVVKAKGGKQAGNIRLSLAETVHLPYRPTSFKVSDMRRVIADVKRAQG